MSEQLQEAIQRVINGSRNETDIRSISAALQAGQLTLVTGNGGIGVSGDATNAILVTGSNNIIVQGEVAESLQAILERFSPHSPKEIASVDELVQQVRSRIHDDIQHLHGSMPLWGVDHWVPLGELFVDVNILEEVNSNRRSELADLWQDFRQNPGYRGLDRMGLGKERQRVSGLEVLTRNTNLMVVGKPGSGKTTYLQRVVTECNGGNLQAHRIPVLIRLREFVDDGRKIDYAVEHYLERVWRLSAAETQLVLDAGRSLVLLDGLDEVTGEDGKAIAKQIKRFARDYPQVQVIVTCRTQSQESRFERFDAVEVADFNEPQVRAFAEHWFQTVCGDLTVGQAKATAFLEQLFREENKPIRELAITPILLSLTCAVFQQTGKFYSKRSKLYEEGLELLLEQWDKSREIERDEVYRDLSVERKLELLSYLAVKKFEQEQYVLFEQAEIEEYIAEFLGIEVRESRSVLRAIEAQHGLLIERSQKIWSFSHLTFQEYLVANSLAKMYNPSALIPQGKQLKNIGGVTRKHWREVFLIASSILKDPSCLLRDVQVNTNELIKSDRGIQIFMDWVYQKASSMNVTGKSAALRAFYFAFSNKYRCSYERCKYNDDLEMIYLGLPYESYSDRNYRKFDFFNMGSDLNFGLSLYLGLDFGAGGAGGLRSCSIDTISNLLNPHMQKTVDSNELREIKIDFCAKVVMDIAENFSEGRIGGGDPWYDALETFNFYFTHILDKVLYNFFPDFKLELKEISGLIPAFTHTHDDLIKKNSRKSLHEFWKENGKSLLEQLRGVFVSSRNIGYDWQFNEIQMEKLKIYYYSNKLLLDCLSQSEINPGEKQYIEEGLLLPISEIENCSRGKVE